MSDDDDEIQVLESIAKRIHEGSSRSDIVASLIESGASPQQAQDWYAVADRYAAGQGYLGYNAWFWSIFTGKAVHARGAAWLWLTAVAAMVIAIPATFGWTSSLPSGKYPVVLLAAPALFLAAGATYLIGYGLFTRLTRRAD